MINGKVADGFEPVRDVFLSLWDDIEVGASLSAYVNGKQVVDLWGGFTDRARTVPWQRDTLVNTYSSAKGVVAIALACLVENNLLEYEKPVSDYWPQFGAQQKFDITVAELISHQAGLYQFEPAIEPPDLYDWQAMTFRPASQKPAWDPGSAFGYHALTWGYLTGELIRQVTGKSAGEFIRECLPEAEFYIGLSKTEQTRCADVIGPNHARVPLSPKARTQTGKLTTNDPLLTPYKHVSSSAWRAAEIPSTNGHANAAGLATCYRELLAPQFISSETLAAATREQTAGELDLVLGQPLRRAMGFILNCDDCYFGPAACAFGHSGTGGSIGFADPTHQVAFAYVMNQLHYSGAIRSRRLIDAFYNCL